MKTRMQPIGNAWQKLPRIVRDLSGELGKQIELEMHGADTELDRQVLDLIKDPLTHMVRNSADHGLETPAERAAAEADGEVADKIANQSIRVNVDTLEHLMTMVSELVLTRNQLLEISRRNEDTEFKVPLQRLSNVTAELQEGVMKTRMQPIGNAWQKLPRDRKSVV